MEKLYKAGTLKEMEQIVGKIPNLPEEVYREVLRIVKTLEEVYGADRDVGQSDGGFVLVAENLEDLRLINRQYIDIDKNRHEVVGVVKSASKTYINAFFLCHNEFGINIFMPIDIAPPQLLDGTRESG
jgi:hypothetical protein